MGTKLALSFANLFMGYFEERFVSPYRKQPFLWKRFIDDIFIIWTYCPEELSKFVTNINSVHETIKFTCEHSVQSVDILDITIQLSGNNPLKTTLFCKPTDTPICADIVQNLITLDISPRRQRAPISDNDKHQLSKEQYYFSNNLLRLWHSICRTDKKSPTNKVPGSTF